MGGRVAGGGVLPYWAEQDVPFLRVSLFSENS